MKLTEPFRKYENAHIVFWLIKDLCWCLLSRELGMLMVLPTICLAVLIAYSSRKDTTELYPNLAVVFWISANSIWMTGEFYFNDTFRPFAICFFVLGIGIMAFYYFQLLIKNMSKKKPLE